MASMMDTSTGQPVEEILSKLVDISSRFNQLQQAIHRNDVEDAKSQLLFAQGAMVHLNETLQLYQE